MSLIDDQSSFITELPVIEEGQMSISARRKSVFENRPVVSKVRQAQRGPVKAAALRVHPFRVNAAELARRKILHLAAGAAVLPAMPRSAEAQTYPTRPITMIVPFPAGGPNDVIARIIAERMRSTLEQPIIIENVTGAGGEHGCRSGCSRTTRWLHA
jgi:hypothetical protein